MSASSSSSSGRQPLESRPQQYGVHSEDAYRGILRQTPPSGQISSSRAWSRPQHQHQQHQQSQRAPPSLTPTSSWSSGPTTTSSTTTTRHHHYHHTPLVLDAASTASSVSLVSSPEESTSLYGNERTTTPQSSSVGLFRRHREAPQSAPPLQRQPPSQHHHQHEPNPLGSDGLSLTTATTAAYMAREAPHAGFLQKLGAHVPAFKRRFFVLLPSTCLYYFLSPNDTEPRGCLDLQGSRLEHVGEVSDGRYRFALVWDDRKVLLEARSKAVAEEWMQRLERERLGYVQAELQKTLRKNSAYQSRIRELEQQVADLRLVEKDRDGALEDAAKWKKEFERLDESLRRLTQLMRRPPQDEQEEKLVVGDTKNGSDTNKDGGEEATKESQQEEESEPSPHAAEMDASRDTSLLDEAMEKEGVIDALNVPGIHFSALFNACEQLRESLRLASVEASTAVEDLNAANERVVTVEKRMAKAEKQLIKLWEENCSVRKALKQKKREKRVLVREVKNLLEAAKTQKLDDISLHGMPEDDSSSMACGSDEEKLISELEEHVMSSIRLHEQMLTANGVAIPERRQSPSEPADSSISASGATLRIENKSTNPSEVMSGAEDRTKPLPALASLFDEESDSEDEDTENGSCAPSLSSVAVETSDTETNGIIDAGIVLQSKKEPTSSQNSTPERPHPLVQLDEDEESTDQPNLCAASSQSESSKSVLTTKGEATSLLVCPLADVVDTKKSGLSPPTKNEEAQVYHLSFYSRKIGLQFQKVPPPPAKAKGLLTDAMTADLTGIPNDNEKTSAELRRIAAFSTYAKTENDKEETLQVATPVDAVLVCGFHGFDDSGSNIRPRLGARLVAFDGVSVEVGRWTFDSIRKSIQARGRPLTLSFRNDFLTTEQRTILTKAVKETNAAVPPPRRTIQYPLKDRPPSVDPSVTSHETDHFVNAEDGRTAHSQDDDLSMSVTGSDTLYDYLPQSFSGARSISSFTHGSNFRSFSEAGSSTSVLSAVAPLVSNLLGRSSEPFTPEYLRREPESVEDTPQHQDFKSELL